MKKILILEDNISHMKGMVKMMEGIPEVEIYEATNIKDAHELLLYNDFNLFLIDIILDSQKTGDVSGIEFVKMLRESKRYQFIPIIFITALKDPYLSTFREFHCYAYIEKPVKEEELLKTVKEALEYPEPNATPETVFFRKDGVLFSVKAKDITHITVGRKGVNVYTTKDCMKLSYKPISEILKELKSDTFIQCSRSTIVNRAYIENVDLSNRYLKLKNNDEIVEIGSVMKKYFRQGL